MIMCCQCEFWRPHFNVGVSVRFIAPQTHNLAYMHVYVSVCECVLCGPCPSVSVSLPECASCTQLILISVTLVSFICGGLGGQTDWIKSRDKR